MMKSFRTLLVAPVCLLMGLSVFAQDADQVFTTVQPCVLFDTRPSQGGTGAMAANELRAFHVVGSSSSFASQGGVAGGCGIPGFVDGKAQVSSVLINLVAISPTGGGNLKAWAADQAETGGGVVNYQALAPAMNNSNAVIVEVRQDVEGNDILVRANASAVQVRGVALGYFAPSGVDVEFREDFVNGVAPGDFQCDVWNHFRSRLHGKQFLRLTFFGSATATDFVCSDPDSVTAIAQALAEGAPTPVSVACGGETWTVGGCAPTYSYDGLGLELTLGNNCDCHFRETVRPCFMTDDWGGLGGANCGYQNPTSQTIIVRFER